MKEIVMSLQTQQIPFELNCIPTYIESFENKLQLYDESTGQNPLYIQTSTKNLDTLRMSDLYIF